MDTFLIEDLGLALLATPGSSVFWGFDGATRLCASSRVRSIIVVLKELVFSGRGLDDSDGIIAVACALLVL